MTETLPTWGVVATVDEPAPLVLAFIAHHLDLGASEVHVFLDRPNPDVQQLTQGMAGVFVTLCDDAYWAGTARGQRPPRHTGRQKFNATSVYETTNLDWILHCDADEYIWSEGVFAEELVNVPEKKVFVRVQNVERCYAPGPIPDSIFGGLYRWPFSGSDPAEARIYGEDAPFLNNGFTGHRIGKAVMRAGQPYRFDIHNPIKNDAPLEGGRTPKGVPFHRPRQSLLVHYDGLTLRHWAVKMLKRAYEPVYSPPRNHGDYRVRQITKMRDLAADGAAIEAFCRAMKCLDPAREKALRAEEAIMDIPIAPEAAVARWFPGANIDLTCASFDAELRIREAELIATAGLTY